MVKDPVRAELRASFFRVRDGILLSGIGVSLAFPYIYHQAHSLYPKLFSQPPTSEKMTSFILGELILYFFSLLLFVLIGNLANRRAELNPFRYPGKQALVSALALGLGLIPVSYLLYDHLALALLPEAYPDNLFFALVYPFSFSFPQELFNRFGLLALLAWIFGKEEKKRKFANFLCALLLTGFGFYDFNRLVNSPLKGSELVFLLFGIFILQYLGNQLYLKNGFWSSLVFRIALSLKFPLYFFLFLNY